MPLFFVLICFLSAALGLALFARGMTMASSAYLLEQRITRAGAPVTVRRSAIALPTLFVARGRDGQELAENLRRAGLQEPAALTRFILARIVATIAAFLLAALFSRWMWGGFFAKIPLLLLAPAIVYLAAKRLLLLVAAERQRSISAEFPFLLDLMQTMLESGVGLDQCFRAIGRDEIKTVPHLGQSIRALVDDLDRGMSYESALERWATRVAVPGTGDLAALFHQGLFQGVELSPALRQFAREFSERRVAAAREAVGRISVQLAVVMIVFFLPAMFIVVGGPPATAMFEIMKGMKR